MQKIGNFFQKVIDWVVLSSANPQAVGLSVKSGLLVITSALTQVIGLTHLNIPDVGTLFNASINDIDTVITDALMLVGAVGIFVGGIRKIYLTFAGRNVAITQNPTTNGTQTVVVSQTAPTV